LKLRHLDELHPVCPVCRVERNEENPVSVTINSSPATDDVTEGIVQCPAPACQREYPIIDGIPLLVPDVPGYLGAQLAHITMRDDLSGVTESILGEGAGAGSPFDVARTQLSSYAWDHYGEWDPELESQSSAKPGSVARVLEAGLALAERQGVTILGTGPLLDLGCGAGRSTFELANRTGNVVVGVDLGYHLLRQASWVLRHGSTRYPLRRGGLLYQRREFPVPIGSGARVDFWAGDAINLPFPSGSFAGAAVLNLLDCAYSPLALLQELTRVLRPGAAVVIAAPYDWTPSATPVEAWIGGHSPRSLGGGGSAPVLRALLTPGGHPMGVAGLEIVAELDDIPWSVRMHDRSVVGYRVHLVVAARR
jgi:SAM-dependent methyltransferase/uncharacterized protein YbaR (Trm112 family)